MRWNCKRSIFKNHRNCLPVQSRQKQVYGVYVTRHWNLMNSYWTFWIGCLSVELAQSSLGDEQFLRFSKNDLSWFNRIFLLFDKRKSGVFEIFLLRSIKAYLCPNIINFDIMDFSERRPEEVISFFWRSVYIGRELRSLNVYIDRTFIATRDMTLHDLLYTDKSVYQYSYKKDF